MARPPRRRASRRECQRSVPKKASVIARTFDALGRGAGYALRNDAGTAVDQAALYGFDAVGRFSSVSWSNYVGSVWRQGAYSRLSGSDLIQQINITSDGAAVMSRTLVYEDGRDLIDCITNQAGAAVISCYNYANDAIGRRTAVTNTGTAFSSATNEWAWLYNTRSELTNGQQRTGSVTNRFGYGFDNIGNRQAASSNSAALAYLCNALNQYTNVTLPGVTNRPAYDPDGNLTNDGVNVYTWNGESRLIAAQPLSLATGSRRVQMEYDYMGRRVKKVVSLYTNSAWQGLQTNVFLYDGWNLLKERELGGPVHPGKNWTNYLAWGLDLSGSLQGAGGIGGLLAITVECAYDAAQVSGSARTSAESTPTTHCGHRAAIGDVSSQFTIPDS